MKPQPIWFGSVDRPLAGFLHVPSGQCVGGVLVCAPFGYEAVCAHRSLRRLADRLAADGHLVLRFDYEGTGGSSGAGTEPDLLDRWVASVRCGVAELRTRGIRRPFLVGLRLGAALACAAASDDGELGGLALWSPVTSGRRYHRELRAQAALTPGGVVGDGSLNVFGYLLPAGTQQALRTWHPLSGIDPQIDVLVMQSPGWRDTEEAAADLRNAGLRPTFLEVEGTAGVLERDAELASVPVALLNRLSCWISMRTRSTPEIAAITPDGESTRVVDVEGEIQEEIISLPPAGLYGVLTRPAERPTNGDAVVFLNNGAAPAAGPGRAWVEFGRALALGGTTSLRLDLSGLGDSPDRSRRPVNRDNPVPPTAGIELLAAADRLRDDGMSMITAVGLCSGAHIAVRTAAYAGRLDNVFAINPPLYNLTDIGLGPRRRRLWGLTAFPLSKRPIRRVANWLPEWVWRLLDQLGVFPSTARFLRDAARRGTMIRLVFGEGDRSLGELYLRSGRDLDQLLSSESISLDVIEGMDHSMFDRRARATVLKSLRDYHAMSAEPLDRYACR